MFSDFTMACFDFCFDGGLGTTAGLGVSAVVIAASAELASAADAWMYNDLPRKSIAVKISFEGPQSPWPAKIVVKMACLDAICRCGSLDSGK